MYVLRFSMISEATVLQNHAILPAAQGGFPLHRKPLSQIPGSIQIFPSFLRIFSGVIGQLSIQTPQASWIAIPMAGAAPLQAISEIDLALP